MTKEQKPIISTMINTTALALTAFGASILIKEDFRILDSLRGCALILFGAGLEFFKYWGMKKKLW